MDESLEKIKQMENSLKAFLLAEFGTYLPEDKVSLLNSENYAKENLLNQNLDDAHLRGAMARTMLKDLINVECTKNLTVSEGLTIDLPYGQSLQEALIEYYARNLADKYGFDINQFPELANDIEIVKLLNEKLDNTLDKQVFNSDAVKLIQAAGFKELLEKEDTEAINKYLERNKKLADDNLSKDKQNELVSEYFERPGSIQVTWINDKKHIKYTDPDGKVHLSQIEGYEKTNDFIKQQIASVKPGEKLDPEKFYSEIKRMAGEITLTDTKDVDKEQLNYEEVDMLEFINSNKKIREKAKEKQITHNNLMTKHVIEETNDIVYTEDHLDRVEAKVIKDGNAEMTDEVKQDEMNLQNGILEKEEFLDLMDRFEQEPDSITKEEAEAIRRTINYYKEHEMELPKRGAVLSPYNKNNPYSGYAGNTVKNLTVLTVLLVIVLIAIIMYIMK